MNRELSMEFVRVTEAAAIASGRGVGLGDKNGIDQLAVDAMRKMFDTVNISGTVVIGEGEMDEAPMLYIGEHVGAGGPEVDIAVDPVEGTNLVAKGQNGAIAVIAIAPKGCLLHAPDMYMDKIAVGPRAKGCINIDDPVAVNLERVAKAMHRNVNDLVVVALDRPRHRKIIEEVRAAGARIRLISDGDVNPIIETGLEGSGVHMYIGRGGAPEGVLAACGLKCLGGDMQARLVPENEDQVERCRKMGIEDTKKILTIDDLVKGDDAMFTATAITNCDNLRGVNYFGNGARTDTISMRYATGTVRFVDAVHTFNRDESRLFVCPAETGPGGTASDLYDREPGSHPEPPPGTGLFLSGAGHAGAVPGQSDPWPGGYPQ